MTDPNSRDDPTGIRIVNTDAVVDVDNAPNTSATAPATELPPETQPADSKAKPPPSGLGPYFRVWTYATTSDHMIRAIGIAAALADGAALPLMTLVFGDMVDTFNDWEAGTVPAYELLSQTTKNSLWFTYLFIAILALSFLMNTCFKIVAARSTKALRREFIRNLMRQEISYFDSCLPGSVATLISNNADLIENGMGERLGLAIEGLGQLATSFVVAFIRQWKLTLVVASLLPLTIAVIGVSMFFMVKIDVRMLQIHSRAGGLAEESLSTMPIVTAFGAHQKLKTKYDDLLKGAKELGGRKGPITGFQYSVQWSITFIAYAVAWFYGVRLLADGELKTGGRVITVLTSVLIGIMSMTLIVPAIAEFAKASAAAQGLFDIIDRKSDIDPLSSEGSKPASVTGHLVLEDISFAYSSRPSVKILDKLTLEFEAGKTTAIVGPSGSGKSTIVSMLTRWFDPESGCVHLDGQDIRDLDIHWLRSQMGFVQQESVLFSDTIFNNISHGLFGTPQDSASHEEKLDLVREACKQSFADGFVEELPEGYDTFVGARGNLLSGGQKQRVAIARSIVRNPPILLLDEATSALDPRAEGIVQKALDNVSKARTTIVIAHKLATVQKADKIIVLSKGKLMEQGTHQELLTKKGLYAALVAAQSLEQQQKGEDLEAALQEGFDTASDSAFPEKDVIDHFEAAERDLLPIERQQAGQLTVFQSMMKIVKEQRRLWPLFLGGLLGAIGSGSVFPVQAIVFSRAILIFQYPLPEMTHMLQSKGKFWGWMFLAIALGVLLCYAALGLFFNMIAYHVSSFYRSKYFAAMINQDIGYFEGEGHSASVAISRLSTDPQRVQDLISTNLGFILQTLVNVIGSCTLALAVGWKIAVVAIFGCLPPLFLAGFVRMRIELTSQERMTEIYLESARFGAEAVSAIRTVSSLKLEEKIMTMYNERLDTKAAQSLLQTLISNFLFALTESVYLATLALVFWWGVKLLSQHEYSVQEFFMVFVAVIFGGQAAGFMFGSTLTTTKAMGSAKNIMNLLVSKPPINTSVGTRNVPEKRSAVAVEFKDVNFTYPSRPNAPVLHNLSFNIKDGDSIGIAGASGSGKSTIVALLERFYEANSGNILIHGIPLQELDVHAHRSRIGLVSQDTTLYQGSLRDNVLFGIPDDVEIGAERVTQACKDANIHEFIQSLPEGYDTDAGTRGISLSGGQRQRLAIARALVRNPEILLLDEATSALDSESEALVQEAIEKASKGRTTIAVAHRLSTIQRCDRIMVLHAGSVVEEGSHAELYARRGRYYQMVMAQSLDKELAQS